MSSNFPLKAHAINDVIVIIIYICISRFIYTIHFLKTICESNHRTIVKKLIY